MLIHKPMPIFIENEYMVRKFPKSKLVLPTSSDLFDEGVIKKNLHTTTLKHSNIFMLKTQRLKYI